MTGEKIMIVDDEPEIVELIELYLLKEGFQVISIQDGSEVIDQVMEHRPDLIILDILLPGMDGIEVCRQLRKKVHTPILFVSCRGEDMDIILGLSMGGDDYITKPFSPSQLVARVKAHLRRTQFTGQPKGELQMLTFPGLEINLLSHHVHLAGQLVPLSSKEFDLLVQLARTPNKVYKIEQLYRSIWGVDSNGDTRTLLVHISNLRKKIEQNPTDPKYIVTVRGVGYKFSAVPLDAENAAEA
ncbi:response regulator transcription factor [Paenibacillus thalictri]|uniref:Response regulator transcription factor n=1 Tax=Paenibacillus thalictri TaxID=2527873 RepID=A0A4Q9DHZ5_9BACL|nr:response regulator transcription factor [Paenibacillus thalictri]TBL72678.1 response regulator transcription factor [Paenibacillus thalictri]